jgi:adenylate kinase
MRTLLIGAPGSGKGTQAVQIAAHFGVTHISSGDLLRRHVTDGTATGKLAQQYVDRGDLVPDALVMDMLRKPVLAANESGGYVLDGFPRSVDQAKRAYETASALGVSVQIAVYLDVPTQELVRRLTARGRGNEDSAEVIAHRLEVFHTHTLPMLRYYQDREELVIIDGARPPAEVTASLLAELEAWQRKTADA